jgi:hypothetical protein
MERSAWWSFDKTAARLNVRNFPLGLVVDAFSLGLITKELCSRSQQLVTMQSAIGSERRACDELGSAIHR